MEENKTKPEKKTMTLSSMRADNIMMLSKDFRKYENLSDSEAYKKATLIDSYLYGGHAKRGIIYRGDDKLILKNLPDSKKIKKETKKTSILNKGN
jgi:hypothetical protein